MEASPFCIHQIDFTGRLISGNPAALKILGHAAPTPVLGSHFRDFVVISDRERIAEMMENAFRGERVEYEFESIGGRYLRSNLVPVFDRQKSVTSLIGITEDITERKVADDRIRASEERHRLVVMAARDPIWEIDLHAGEVSWNEKL